MWLSPRAAFSKAGPLHLSQRTQLYEMKLLGGPEYSVELAAPPPVDHPQDQAYKMLSVKGFEGK